VRGGSRRSSVSEVRDLVERVLLAARRKAELDATYERMLSEYTVVVEEEATTLP
jgi:hypothetical protein